MQLFYCPDAALHQTVTLDDTESHHAVKVLRKRKGDVLYVFDGKGRCYETEIVSTSPKQVVIKVDRLYAQSNNTKPSLHIAVAPPKNTERLEWLLEKLTETGVQEITLLLCKHSERRKLKTERLHKILLSACKQSVQFTVPKFNHLTSFSSFIKLHRAPLLLIAYCEEHTQQLLASCQRGKEAIILVGPEGDFAPEEVLAAKKEGYKPVSLGQNRLRLETAALYSAVVFNAVNE